MWILLAGKWLIATEVICSTQIAEMQVPDS